MNKWQHITYEIIIADKFDDNGLSSPIGDSIYRNDVEFTFLGADDTDNLKIADKILDKWVEDNYPFKNYRIYYWWWDLKVGEPRFSLEGLTTNE